MAKMAFRRDSVSRVGSAASRTSGRDTPSCSSSTCVALLTARLPSARAAKRWQMGWSTPSAPTSGDTAPSRASVACTSLLAVRLASARTASPRVA